jgi:hypothetical protein
MVGMTPSTEDESPASAVAVAVIDGPYDAAALLPVLAKAP